MSVTRRIALALFIGTFVIYLFPLMYNLLRKPFFTIGPGIDIVATSFLPAAILENGDFALDQFQDYFRQAYPDPFFVARVNGRLVSRYPVSTALIAMPFYGLPLGTGWLHNTGRDWLTYPRSLFAPAKFAAAFLTALTVVMIFFCARELADARTSAMIAIVFAFGTSVWSTASQALWQQTASILFQALGIWFILRGKRLGANAVAPGAFFFSLATIARMNDAFAAALFTLYVFFQYRAALWKWIAWAIPPVLFVLGYNTVYNGSPLVFGYQEGFLNLMSLPRLDGILGLFISPSRGLLIYSPFLLLSAVGLWRARTESNRLFYFCCAGIFALNAVLLSTFQNWDGGWGYGTRLLVDGLPYAVLLLTPILPRLHGWQTIAFWGSLVYAAIVQSFGLWDYGEHWHWHWDNWQYDVWNIAENEPLFYLKQYLEMLMHLIGRG
jgi:hypothetical protein